tara:strand:+ start:4530 stop:4832 length:303 start_codon:yes stop_codon:yes gene_type:complete
MAGKYRVNIQKGTNGLGAEVRREAISGLQILLGIKPNFPNGDEESKADFQFDDQRVQVYTLNPEYFCVNAKRVNDPSEVERTLLTIAQGYEGLVQVESYS